MIERIDGFLIAQGLAADDLSAVPWRGGAYLGLASLLVLDAALAAMTLANLLGPGGP